MVALFSGGSEGFVFAIFISIVLGIPAAGFATLMFGLSATFGAAALATGHSSAMVSNAPNSPVSQNRWLVWLSYCCFGAAILWSVPYGFITFVQMVTGDPVQAVRSALTWLGVAVPLIACGFIGRFVV
ncbi:MAG: hypothetical protein AAFP16_05540 [Pseudomonadota bacterium]